jgi:hypothetical protein
VGVDLLPWLANEVAVELQDVYITQVAQIIMR